jgi:GT2 family glycosyltransferase
VRETDLSVAIPTYQRESVLVATLEALLAQPAAEVLVVDQTPHHEPGTEEALSGWQTKGKILWLRLETPSITHAMNTALVKAHGSVVLFLDDDIIPAAGLLSAHVTAYSSEEIWAVAGQVLQPGQEPAEVLASEHGDILGASLEFPFNSTRRAWIRSGMAGNLSVRRDQALRLGGFDENFVGVAYRFETEFCSRLADAGGKILFEPAASIRHLKAPRGGTRAFGNHLTSVSPAHGVGDYYFALRRGFSVEMVVYILRRPFREITTHFHLRHPWWVPVKWLGEMAALVWALALSLRGARYVHMAS